MSLGLELRIAEATALPDLGDLRRVLSSVGTGLNDVLDNLRELSRGLHPAVLTEEGSARHLARSRYVQHSPSTCASTSPPSGSRPQVEVIAYYVASEASTNTAKHADASQARVTVRTAMAGLS